MSGETMIERMRARGEITWLSSDGESGPDVGLSVGLGNGQSLYVGELANQTVEESGIDTAEYQAAWWFALEGPHDICVIGPVADIEAARLAMEALSAALRAAIDEGTPS